MTDSYLTISGTSTGEYTEKRSKFLAFAFHVENVDEVKALVQQYEKQYYDARHVCYAYRIHPTMIETRANDDGEPSGTAGKPILGVLVSKDLVNVLVVVVRYFGGTLLGTSGLITAYREATLDAIDHNEIIEKKVEVSFTIYFGYLVMNDVMKIIKDENPTVLEQTFDNDCKMLLQIRVRDYDKIINRLQKVEGLKIE